MAYNNYFPVGYQPYYQQAYSPVYQPQMGQSEAALGQAQVNSQPTASTPQNGIIWVQGEAGAKAYPVAPNNTVQLWDSENQIIYLKSADMSGMPSMKILDYTIRESQQRTNAIAKTDMSAYITREEFEKKIAELKGGKHESNISELWKESDS